MDFSKMLVTQGSLFCILLIGFYIRKKNMGGQKEKSFLSALAIHITIPATILKSFQKEITVEVFSGCIQILIISVLIQIGSFLLAHFLYRDVHPERRKVMQYASTASNSGSLGTAVAEGVFGDLGVLYAGIYVIPMRIFMWSVGLTYFTDAPNKKEIIKKVLTHPCIAAVFIGIGIALLPFELPAVITKTIGSVASANTFVSMAVVGMVLGDVKIKTIVERDVLRYSFVRLILIPAMILTACVLFRANHLVSQVAVVLASMPAPSVTTALSTQYHRDEIFATKCVVFSTLLSMLTVPFWCLLLAYIIP